MSDLRTRSALGKRPEPSGLTIGVSEIKDRGMIDLRGLASDQAVMEAAKSVIDADLPTIPRTSLSSGEINVLWLSIDQWLILCPLSKVGELAEREVECLLSV